MDQAVELVGGARHLGEFVRQERIRRGMSQRDLAIRADMSQGDVSAMENGHKFVLRTTVVALGPLADALGDDEPEKGRLLRAMLLMSGMGAQHLDAILTFDPAMIRERAGAELVPV